MSRRRPLTLVLLLLAMLVGLTSGAPYGFGAYDGQQLPSPFYRELRPAFGPLRAPPPPVFRPMDNRPGFYHHFIGHRW